MNIKKTLLPVIALFLAGALSSLVKGQNTHAIVPQSQVDPNFFISSAAYTNYIDHNREELYFFSVEVEAGNALIIRKLDDCLVGYKEQYRRSLPAIRSVHDVIQVSNTYSGEYYSDEGSIAFCGQYNTSGTDLGTVFIADSRLNLIRIRSYEGFRELYSMVEIPGEGYMICGKTVNETGMYMHIDYHLNPVVCFETPAILKHVVHDTSFDQLLLAGIYRNELWIYSVKVQTQPNSNPGIIASVAYTYPSAQWFDNVKVLPWNRNMVMLFSSAEVDPAVNHGHTHNGLISFVELRRVTGATAESHFLFAFMSNTDKLGIVRDAVSWYGNKTFYMLMDYTNTETRRYGSVLVESDLEHGTWKGVKIKTYNTGGLLRMHQLDTRKGCNRLSIAGYEDYPGGYSRSGFPRHSRYVNMTVPLPANGVTPACEEEVKFDHVFIEPFKHIPVGLVPGDLRDLTPELPALILNGGETTILCQGECPRGCIRSAARENNGERYGMMEGETMQVSESIVVKAEAIVLTSSDYMQYWILDVSGRELNHGTATRSEIPLNTLKTGVYILRLQKTDGSFEHHKFVKP